MKGMDVIDALADVREDWLEDAAPKGGRKPPKWAKYLSLAACLTVLAAFSGMMLLRFTGGQGQQGSVQTPDGAAVTTESSQEEAATLSEQEQFYACFYQLDRSTMEAYVDAHPEVLAQGWSGIDINAAGLEDSGTEIHTTQGDQVLALDAKNGILLIRVELDGSGNASRGVLAICKDTSQLRLCAASALPDSGETVGAICQENGGLLALTGSAFWDDGSSDGGAISGLAICSGTSLGEKLGAAGDKRLELRQELGPAAGFVLCMVRGRCILLQRLRILRQHFLDKMRRLMGGGAGNGSGDMAGASGACVPHMNGHIHKLTQVVEYALYNHAL